MSTVGQKSAPTEKKSKAWACCVGCLITLIVLAAVAVGASVIAFNKLVSPIIGDVSFGGAVSLLSGVYNSDEDKLVTDPYTEQDLDDFYATLNARLFQTVKSETELTDEYNALPDEEKQAYASLTDYCKQNKYTITIDKLLEVANIDQLLQGDTTTMQVQDIPQEPLQNYLDTLAAAGDGTDESGDEQQSGGDSEQQEDMLKKLLAELNFDFSSTKEYNYLAEQEDYTVTNLTVSGKQAAAVVGEVIDQVLGKLNLFGEDSGLPAETVEKLQQLDLSQYIGVPQVIFAYTEEENPSNQTVMIKATVKLNIRDLLNNEGLRDSIIETVNGQMSGVKINVGKMGYNAVKMLLPKKLFVTLGIYPLDETRPAYVRINNYSQKNCDDLQKIVNAVVHTDLFPDDTPQAGQEGEQTSPATPATETPVFVQVNAKVAQLFGDLNQMVPVEFESDGDNKALLKVAHIQMLLSLMELYDPNDIENSVTPHMFMTTLRCLFDATTAPAQLGDLNLLYRELETKYGIDQTYWNDHNLLDTTTTDDLIDQIDMTGLVFADNAAMRVSVPADQLAALVSQAIEDGLLTQDNTDVAAAGESTGDGGGDTQEEFSIVDALHLRSIRLVQVDKKDNTTTYRMAVKAAVTLADLLQNNLQGEQAIVDSLTEALPEELTFGLELYIQDTQNEQLVVRADNSTFGLVSVNRVVGKEVNDTGVLINKFDVAYTQKVLDTISLMMTKLGGQGLDLDDIIATLEESFANVFSSISESLGCSIWLEAQPDSENTAGKVLLPSLYELVQGLSRKQIDDKTGFSYAADLLSLDEIRGLFDTLYASTYQVDKYEGTPADDLLHEIQSKYYLSAELTSADLFDGTITDKLTADSLNMTGDNGLYHDTRAMSDLDVMLKGDALADLINQSGQLTDAVQMDMIESLTVQNCTYQTQTVGDRVTMTATLDCLTVLGLGTQANPDTASIDGLLPENLYLGAQVLLYDSQGYDQTGRFNAKLTINGQDASNFLKLIRVFTAETADEGGTDTLQDTVATSLQDAFASIEDTINITYGQDSIVLGNVFNTINKLSHKPTEEELNDPAYVPYEPNPQDDQDLADRLREFGRNPKATTNADGIVDNVDVVTFAAGRVYTATDLDDFFALLNENLYTYSQNESGKVYHITAQTVTQDTFEINSDWVNFRALYQDTRSYEQLATQITDRYMGALVQEFVVEKNPDGTVNESTKGTINLEGVGQAKIIQVGIGAEYLEALVQVTLDPTAAAAELLPDTLYILANSSLLEGDDYATRVRINSMTVEQTADLFDRIDLLNKSFNANIDIQLSQITTPIQDQVRSLFQNNLNDFGIIHCRDGYIELPTLFSFLTDGAMQNGEYNTDLYMYETDENDQPLYQKDEQGNLVLDAQDQPVKIKTDPVVLMNNLREFGREPAAEHNTVRAGDPTIYEYNGQQIIGTMTFDNDADGQAIEQLEVYRKLDINLASDDDNIFKAIPRADGTYWRDNPSLFFAHVNDNFYISKENELSSSRLTDSQIVIDNTFVDFSKIYKDTREFDEIETLLDGVQLCAICNLIYPNGINLGDGQGVATLVQMHFYGADAAQAMGLPAYVTLKTIVRVALDDPTGVLPQYLYLTCFTIIDSKAQAEGVRFDTQIIINSMAYTQDNAVTPCEQSQESNAFFRRLDRLSANFGVQFDLTLSSVKDDLKTEFGKLFDDYLSIFGKIEYPEENNSIRLPNLFEYLTEGKLANDPATGRATYYTDDEYRMKEGTNADGTAIYTDARDLMLRLREFGQADIVADFADIMYQWENGRPSQNNLGKRYNANPFAAADEQDFYQQLQAYYFFRDMPDHTWLDGSSNIFDGLTGDNLEALFNLHGLAVPAGITGTMADYLACGLFGYNGRQVGVKLSDKALGSIINSQQAIALDNLSGIKAIEITSFALQYDQPVQGQMTIEITVRVTTNKNVAGDTTATSLPNTFYLTTSTVRDTTYAVGDARRYTTEVTVNRFAPNDLDLFLSNLQHLTTFDINNQLNTETIRANVQKALSQMLDTNMQDYVQGYGNYTAEDESKGVGYIEFYTVYHQIVDKLAIDRTAFAGADQDLQGMLVKLHHIADGLWCNAPVGTETFMPAIGTPFDITDRAFANALQGSWGTGYEYIAKTQAIFFAGAPQDTAHAALRTIYDNWQGYIGRHVNDFAWADGTNYIAVTLQLDLTQLTLQSNVQLLPDRLLASVALDDSYNVSAMFFNDMNATETALLLSFVQGEDSDKLNVEDLIKSRVSNTLGGYGDMTYSAMADNTATEIPYAGKITATINLPAVGA